MATNGWNEAADAEDDEDEDYLLEAASDELEGQPEADEEEEVEDNPVLAEFARGPDELKVNEQDIEWLTEKLEKQVQVLEDDLQSQMAFEPPEVGAPVKIAAREEGEEQLEARLAEVEKDMEHYIAAMEIVEGLQVNSKMRLQRLTRWNSRQRRTLQSW